MVNLLENELSSYFLGQYLGDFYPNYVATVQLENVEDRRWVFVNHIDLRVEDLNILDGPSNLGNLTFSLLKNLFELSCALSIFWSAAPRCGSCMHVRLHEEPVVDVKDLAYQNLKDQVL